MTLLKRLPKALLVTLVAFFVLGGGIGFAVAAGTADVPAEFSTPEPVVGDRMAYEVTYTETNDGETETHQTSEIWTWMPAEVVVGVGGRPYIAHPLVIDDGYGGGAMFIDVETKEGVATTFSGAHNITYTGSTQIVGPLGLSSSETRQTNATYLFFERFGAPCGFFHSMQGTIVDPAKGIDSIGDCPEGLHARLKPIGTLMRGGVATVGFRDSGELGTMDLWFAEHVPYPVAIDIDYTFDFAELGIPDLTGVVEIQVEVLMTAFERGEAPWGVHQLVLPAVPAPPIAAAAQTWGPDDSGIDHPYRLSEAWKGAMTSPTSPELREFVADHPDARIVRADPFQRETDDGRIYGWQALVHGGGDWMELEAERLYARGGTPQAILENVVGHRESYDAQPMTFGTAFLTAAEVDRLPTIASAMAHYEVLRGKPANEYSYDLTCFFEFCDDVAVQVGHVQHHETRPDPVTGGPGELKIEKRMFGYAPNGTLAQEMRASTTGSSYQQGLLPLQGTAPAESKGARTEPLPVAGNVWKAPPAEAAAGVGIVALLAGAIYWLWPTLKALPVFGLFSRIHRDDLLEHPVRQSIMDAVASEPGIHYQSLVRKVGKGRGVVEHHTRKLIQSGHLSQVRNEGYTCFFQKGAIDHNVMAVMPVLKSETARAILQAVVEHPGMPQSHVAQAIGVSASTANHHVRRLRESGLIEHGSMVPTGLALRSLAVAA